MEEKGSGESETDWRRFVQYPQRPSTFWQTPQELSPPREPHAREPFEPDRFSAPPASQIWHPLFIDMVTGPGLYCLFGLIPAFRLYASGGSSNDLSGNRRDMGEKIAPFALPKSLPSHDKAVEVVIFSSVIDGFKIVHAPSFRDILGHETFDMLLPHWRELIERCDEMEDRIHHLPGENENARLICCWEGDKNTAALGSVWQPVLISEFDSEEPCLFSCVAPGTCSDRSKRLYLAVPCVDKKRWLVWDHGDIGTPLTQREMDLVGWADGIRYYFNSLPDRKATSSSKDDSSVYARLYAKLLECLSDPYGLHHDLRGRAAVAAMIAAWRKKTGREKQVPLPLPDLKLVPFPRIDDQWNMDRLTQYVVCTYLLRDHSCPDHLEGLGRAFLFRYDELYQKYLDTPLKEMLKVALGAAEIDRAFLQCITLRLYFDGYGGYLPYLVYPTILLFGLEPFSLQTLCQGSTSWDPEEDDDDILDMRAAASKEVARQLIETGGLKDGDSLQGLLEERKWQSKLYERLVKLLGLPQPQTSKEFPQWAADYHKS